MANTPPNRDEIEKETLRLFMDKDKWQPAEYESIVRELANGSRIEIRKNGNDSFQPIIYHSFGDVDYVALQLKTQDAAKESAWQHFVPQHLLRLVTEDGPGPAHVGM